MEVFSHLYLIFTTYGKPISYYSAFLILFGVYLGWKLGKWWTKRSFKKWLKKHGKISDEG